MTKSNNGMDYCTSLNVIELVDSWLLWKVPFKTSMNLLNNIVVIKILIVIIVPHNLFAVKYLTRLLASPT